MGNNNITNIKDPSDPKDAVTKRYLFRRLQRLETNYNLKGLPERESKTKEAIKTIQDGLMENRNAHRADQVSLHDQLKTMEESLRAEIDSNEKEIIRKLRNNVRKGIESLRKTLEKLTERQVNDDELQQKINELNNQFHEDINRSKRIINHYKEETDEAIMQINEQIRLKGDSLEILKTEMEAFRN